MTKLYNQDDLLKINKEKKKFLILMISFCVLFVVILLICLLLSNYKYRLLWSLLTASLDSITIIFIVYFASRFIYLKRLSSEYETLLNKENIVIECEILECSSFITTLPDRSRCYEVLYKIDDKEQICYLSEIFDREEIKPGKCKIITAFDYLKGYEYED